MCGENRAGKSENPQLRGSPPRVRGKPFYKPLSGDDERITPACAGKTRLNTDLVLAAKDHPRVCGENYAVIQLAIGKLGSPPRVRGKLKGLINDGVAQRITPACAGKTLSLELVYIAAEDHPRVCGENAQLPC